jgi:hypothetical protein
MAIRLPPAEQSFDASGGSAAAKSKALRAKNEIAPPRQLKLWVALLNQPRSGCR